jgi:WD40 repeat protein
MIPPAATLFLSAYIIAGPPAPLADLYGDSLPEHALARLGTVHFRPGRGTEALAFSADGKALASVHLDGHIQLWNAVTGQSTARLSTPNGGSVRCLAYSPDGKYLAAGDDQHCIWLWDLPLGKRPRPLKGHTAMVQDLAFAPDSRTLASLACMHSNQDVQDFAVRLWDVAAGQPRATLISGTEPQRGVAFLKDGKQLISVGGDRIHVWDVASAKEVRTCKVNCETLTTPMPLPDGKTVAIRAMFGANTWVELWDVAAGKRLLASENSGWISSTSLSPDGQELAIGGGGEVTLLSTATGKARQILQGHGQPFCRVAFSPDGKRLAGSADSRIYLWDTTAGEEVCRSVGHSSYVNFVRFLPDGKTVLTVSFDQTARLWEAVTGQPLRHFAITTDYYLDGCDLSPDGRTLAVPGHWKGGVGLWDVTSGKKLTNTFTDDFPHITRAAFAPDGKTLAVAAHESHGLRQLPMYTVRLLDAATGKLRHNLGDQFSQVDSLLFSPDGKTLVVSGGMVRMWDMTSLQEVLGAKQVAGRALFFMPDSDALALARGDHRRQTGISILNLKTWQAAPRLPEAPQMHFRGLETGRGRAVFGPLDREDGSVWLRDASHGKLLARMAGHRNGVLAVAFSPDGKLLVTASGDGTGLVWNLPALLKQQRERRTLLSPTDMQTLWKDLGSSDPAEVLEATDRLVEAPDDTVPFLQKLLSPISAAAGERFIEDLDSATFAKREKASQQLARMEFAAARALQKRLAAKPTLEMRQRIEKLLKTLDEPHIRAEYGAAWQAVTVLEQIGTQPACEVLKVLSQGAPDARLTEKAQAALKRRE